MRGMTLQASDIDTERWATFTTMAQVQGFVATTYAAEQAAGDRPLDKLMELHRQASAGWLHPTRPGMST